MLDSSTQKFKLLLMESYLSTSKLVKSLELSVRQAKKNKSEIKTMLELFDQNKINDDQIPSEYIKAIQLIKLLNDLVESLPEDFKSSFSRDLKKVLEDNKDESFSC